MAEGGMMAKGGEGVPYIIWVSKDGEKREFFGNYKSKKAADMAMKKLWDSDDYHSIGNKSKSSYEKEGLYAEGGMMAKGNNQTKYNISFNYNPANLSNEDAEKIVEKYTPDWKHDNDWDEVSFFVMNLSKSDADDLVSELKMEDVYNVEIEKSRYANGGMMESAETGELHRSYE